MSPRLILASGAVTGGTVGFLVVLALVVAAVLLFRSMSRHLRKVPPTFDPPPARDEQPPTDNVQPRTDNVQPRADDAPPRADDA